MRRPDKHTPCRWRAFYAAIQDALIQAKLRGFVLSHAVNAESIAGTRAMVLTGTVECAGNIRIEIMQTLRITYRSKHSYAEIVAYGYKAVLRGETVIFRYDPPHPDHNRFPHKHVCDVFGSGEIRVIPLYQEDQVPTFREVLEETEGWYHEHRERLEQENEDA